jgi:predicted dehydrogenase
VTRIGFLSVAHMHAYGYASALRECAIASNAGVWDNDEGRRAKFAKAFGVREHETAESLFGACDAVVLTSENARHRELGELAARAGKHVLCEKPLATTAEDCEALIAACESANTVLMTAFPCRYCPAFARLKARVAAGDIGRIKAVCATNHGMCPFDWFTDVSRSGGGAMIDHTVHVADLLRDLLDDEPVEVYAQTGNGMYGKEWEDTAMLHVRFSGGVFATIDASWSRPQGYKTWGDVRMNVVGTAGVIELDMFEQCFDVYGEKHTVAGYGSGLDAPLIAEFVRAIESNTAPAITGRDGLQAARVAFAGYESARTSQPVALAK